MKSINSISYIATLRQNLFNNMQIKKQKTNKKQEN